MRKIVVKASKAAIATAAKRKRLKKWCGFFEPYALGAAEIREAFEDVVLDLIAKGSKHNAVPSSTMQFCAIQGQEGGNDPGGNGLRDGSFRVVFLPQTDGDGEACELYAGESSETRNTAGIYPNRIRFAVDRPGPWRSEWKPIQKPELGNLVAEGEGSFTEKAVCFRHALPLRSHYRTTH